MNPNDILVQSYSEEFDQLRKNRIVQSHFKYGSARDTYSNKLVDAMATMQLCVDKYHVTGNTEYLCDAANYLMFEFMWPQHEAAHFRSTGSEESAGIVGMSINEINTYKD